MNAYIQDRSARAGISELKSRCNQRGILVAAHNPTPGEIIPLVERRLAEHQNHFAKNMDPFGGYHTEWKTINDDLTKFLAELRAAAGLPATNNDDKNSATDFCGQNEQPVPTPTNQLWPDCGQTLANTGQDLPNDGQHRPDPCQPLPNTGQATNPPAHPSDSFSETKNDAPPASAADSDEDEEDDDIEEQEVEDDDQIEDDQIDDIDEEDLEELDIDAELDGFENYAELMAEAAADLQAAINKRNRFDALSAEAQAAIMILLDKFDSRFVAKLLVKPPPVGMSFKISKSGLNYFAKRYRKREKERRTQQNANAAADLLDKSQDPDKAFQQAMERLLRMRALTVASEPEAPLETIDAALNPIIKLRKQSLAERKQTHAENQ